jgi:hypothetical protein
VETYNPNYVNPKQWNLTFMGCETFADYQYDNFPDDETSVVPTNRYTWKWNGHSKTGTDCYIDLFFPAQGNYTVELTVTHKDGSKAYWTKPVRVKDRLIVVLGDSSASGEGAPDTRIYPYSTTNARAEWVDNRCHRSNNAGSAQAAKRIEDSDPYTSVTFLSFACSGATMNTEIYDGSILDPYENETDHEYRGVGVLDEYAGIEPLHMSGTDDVDFSQKLPSQIDQLWTALTSNGVTTTREMDALIVAAGINDARFADLAAICTLYNGPGPIPIGCQFEPVGETPGTQRTLHDQFMVDVARVAPGWDALGDALDEIRLVSGTPEKMKIAKRVALTYPPFFHNQSGNYCPELFWDVIPLWIKLLVPFTLNMGWNLSEIVWADTNWAGALNDAVILGAGRNKFQVIDTIADRFFYHGMCASDNWINTPTESGEMQGDADGLGGPLSSVFAKGTAHPNTTGYSAYADEIIEELDHLVGGSLPPVATPDFFNSGAGLPTWHNVLDNDTDPDGDTLTARIVTKPEHGSFDMTPDGFVTYKPHHSYLGTDRFVYEVTDGVFSRFTDVDITVEKPFKVVVEVFDEENTVIGGLAAGGLIGPYQVVLDKLPRPSRGFVSRVVDQDAIDYQAPDVRGRRSVRLPYTVYSTAPFGSPGYGQSVRGILRIRVVRQN